MCIQHKSFKHLSQEERFRIEVLLFEQYSYREIARSMGIHVSVISREISRNQSPSGTYCAKHAHARAMKRRKQSRYHLRKIENDNALAARIESGLRGEHHACGDWSPEVVAQVLLKGIVSHTTIYSWVKRSRRDLLSLLPQRGSRRMRYGSKKAYIARCAANMPSIELRPQVVESREELGHLEGDTVVLKEGRIHTLVERTSRYLLADFVVSLGAGLAAQMSDSAIGMLTRLPLSHRRTITYDRGSEFAWWDMTERALPGTTIYFAHPHRPWERGTNERTNGLLRRYFPKGKKFANLTKTDIERVAWMLNHRPRKILHWRTPCEVFGKCCSSSLN